MGEEALLAARGALLAAARACGMNAAVVQRPANAPTPSTIEFHERHGHVEELSTRPILGCGGAPFSSRIASIIMSSASIAGDEGLGDSCECLGDSCECRGVATSMMCGDGISSVWLPADDIRFVRV